MIQQCDIQIRRNNAVLNEVDGITPLPEVAGLHGAAIRGDSI